MSKFFATVLFIGFVTSIFWIYPKLPAQIPNAFADYGEPSSYSSKFGVIISFASSISIVYLTMLSVSRIIQSKYKRFQKGIDGIFLIVIFVLSTIYTGVMANGLQYNLNMLLFVPLVVGLSLIVTGNEVQRFKADVDTGIPLKDAYNDLWNKVRHFVAKGLFAGGLLMLPCVFFPGKSILFIFLTILGILLATLIFGSYNIYRKHYMNTSNTPF